MSAIRPPVMPPLFPVQTPVAAARASRSDFFRAALQDAMATPTNPGATEASGAPATDASAGERHQRPGALLDIRV